MVKKKKCKNASEKNLDAELAKPTIRRQRIMVNEELLIENPSAY
jgi:hypothetical protein